MGDRENHRIDVEAIAEAVLQARQADRQIPPLSSRHGALDLDHAYQIAAAIRRMREASGETVVGRKIGFTNHRIWSEYDVHAPIWGYVYDRTLHHLEDIRCEFELTGLPEPRIEPEIAFRLARAPDPTMDEVALLGCVDWVAHAFEIVQSIYRGWQFSAPDCVVGFGLHGALLLGRRHSVATSNEAWLRALSTFHISLSRDGVAADRGCASDVLGGPLTALRHLIGVLSRDPANPPLAAGEIITTGTLTRAFPVTTGEQWSTQLEGVSLDPIRLTFI